VGERYRDLGTACIDCHQIQDVHAGRYGGKCVACHDQSRWATIRFDHDKTKFPLRAAHVKVKCDTCHTGDLYHDKLATTCVSCHKKDDVHKGQLGARCEQCHGESSWRQKTEFDHDLARFPLIGRHAVVACEECHRSAQFKGAPLTCRECHRDQHHEGRLGPDCGLCHNPNGWARWRFDHDAQTHYRLTGAHRSLQCHACHAARNVSKIVLASDCYACHRGDDAHQGSFGPGCERCHTTSSFAQRGGPSMTSGRAQTRGLAAIGRPAAHQDVDREARDRMVEFLPRLRRFVHSLARDWDQSEDLVQETCARALGHLDQWEPGTRFDSWMFRIAQNLWFDRVRAEKVRGEIVNIETVDGLSSDGRVAAENRLTLLEVRKGMARLSIDQRLLIDLICLDGLSYKQAAEVLDLPPGTVMSRLARARLALHQAIRRG
jgi:RNA polymerase sigma factor (sigma-70 family)